MRKRRRRKNKHISMGIAVLCLIAAGCLALLLTPVFNIKNIIVTGNNTTSSEDVIRVSGIVKNVNIFSVSLREAESRVSNMQAVESVKIKRALPSTVRITVTEGVVVAYVENNGEYVGVSSSGMVVDVRKSAAVPAATPSDEGEDEPAENTDGDTGGTQDSDAQDSGTQDSDESADGASADSVQTGSETQSVNLPSVPVITGMGDMEYKLKGRIEFSDEKKAENLQRLMEELINDEIGEEITMIDMSVYDNIKFVWKGSLTVRLGDTSDLEYKIRLFKQILTSDEGKAELGNDPSGTLDINTGRGVYRPKKD